jgi:hypothetical protein
VFIFIARAVFIASFLALTAVGRSLASEPGLVGYWKLKGDCQDHSGAGNHGHNHDVDLQTGEFDGRTTYIEVPNASSLNFGKRDFSVAAWVRTQRELEDVIGDIVTKFDKSQRKGFNFTVNASNPGYNGPSNIRNLFFGVDSGTDGKWTDCGRPNEKTHISDALTVYKGDLYAGTTDAPDEADWAHVYRYAGGQKWEDLGRLGRGRTRGVYAIIVHEGELYACTAASHGMQPPGMDFARVYRYLGGRNWEDIGQPGENLRIHGIASYRGKLYVAAFNIGGPAGYIYSYEGNSEWNECGKFDGNPHTLTVHDGHLYTAYPRGEVFAYEGGEWEKLGNPFGSTKVCNQIHSQGVYHGELHIGSWPMGKVAVWRDGKWVDMGRLGDATEVVSLSVYNGSFYAGTIPRAEVFRFDGRNQWTSIRRLFDPPSFEPLAVGSGGKAVEDWTRASGMAVYQGKLFVSTATCYRTLIAEPRPNDIRGKVFSFETGAGVSLDDDMGPGWKHAAAVREGGKLRLYVDGKLAATAQTDGDDVDVSSDAPLRIGFGPQSHFRGNIQEVRLYDRALGEDEMQSIGEASKPQVDSGS